MEILRQRLLENATNQSDLLEIFSAIDRDRSGRIKFEEFHAAIKSLELNINNDDEIKHLFHQFDTKNDGEIDFHEFLQQLRPPMNERRRKASLNLFNSMDINNDGKLTIFDLKLKYAAQLIPNKTRSIEAINLALQKFLNKFDMRDQKNGIIDEEEFLNFCSMLSATIKEDVFFEHALRRLFEFHV